MSVIAQHYCADGRSLSNTHHTMWNGAAWKTVSEINNNYGLNAPTPGLPCWAPRCERCRETEYSGKALEGVVKPGYRMG